ncbi:LrgB family protein [Clostridium fallax]|uniref:TIGR00659 family protein n=1 Tax=Clostridium fallax TaxID=1533 RepID=A0A1M4WVD8_9CLOT|nr:LrgB family protein [Clostridium fallax]SHE85261.1 TIGR00659 family protein [Clostridium fallax]SQB07430.1 LrgB family protein [Clostridium fallax]
MEFITHNALFGIVISLIAFEIGLFIYRKTKLAIFNPLLIAIILIIIFLSLTHTSFDTYNKGAQFINLLLGPSTIILAVPLYKQLDLLKKHALPILLGVFIGCISSILGVVLVSTLVGLDKNLLLSLVPKSVTTPIGLEISKQLNGLLPITVAAIILSGIIGAIIGPLIFKIFKIKNKVAQGISLGTASHAVGTTKALELGETEGAMSSLSIGISGLMTVFLAPIIITFLSKIFIK